MLFLTLILTILIVNCVRKVDSTNIVVQKKKDGQHGESQMETILDCGKTKTNNEQKKVVAISPVISANNLRLIHDFVKTTNEKNSKKSSEKIGTKKDENSKKKEKNSFEKRKPVFREAKRTEEISFLYIKFNLKLIILD